jgi:hypothetical protein
MAVNGKPLENTYVEWQASPYPAKGQACQSCHMPDRQHLWRGIHDPAMVESGLTATYGSDGDKAWFELTNSGVGHAFPTYVTPKVVMRAVALDGDGEPRTETAASLVIQRVVEYADGGWQERSDSRLRPGESATLVTSWQGSAHIRFWLEVHPDDYYDHHVYDVLLEQLSDGEARMLIAEADSIARQSNFTLFEREVRRP